ncbi:NAD(+) diphosphatase [Microbacterium sp.]|uniref:NAD(+) diphosphatase n=1 Tax=Microbacterium sp. TaxID=51671 RepID=UPI0039E5C7AA
MTPQELSRPPASVAGALHRAGAERFEPGLIGRLRADEHTRVLVVQDDRAALQAPGRLRFVAPREVRTNARWAFLGRDEAGAGVLVAALPSDATAADDAGDCVSLRTLGAVLPAAEADTLVTAVCLARWLHDAAFCTTCGERAELATAGWSRLCSGCGREHFPRTDPAVIVAVASRDGERLLLGQNALWAAEGGYSAFAGFVEAGEGLEAAVAREIQEEAGVQVTDLRYRGSQAWPYPRSLMLGFEATAIDEHNARPDGEEIVRVRWFARAELEDALAGEGPVRLPGPSSIAHRLIAGWLAG